MLGGDLIDRDAGLEVGALRRLGVDAAHERRGHAAVAATRIARPLQRGRVVDAAQQQHAILEARQRLQRQRQVVGRSVALRDPVAGGVAVRDIHDREAPRHLRVGSGERRERRHHALEQRQRQRGPQPA
jgi:hypothetical protein